MKKRTLWLTASLLAVMLSLVIGATAASAADPVSLSGSPFVPVQLNADISPQPTVFAVTDVATDPDVGDVLSLAGAGYPCGVEDDGTHFNYSTSFVGNQETCNVMVTDGTGYASVMVNITTTSGLPPNQTPTAAFTAVGGQLAASFDASASSDPDVGDTLTYNWDFGDGNQAQTTIATTSHTYAAGSYTATLSVTDNHGATSATVSQNLTVTAPPPPPPAGPVQIFVSNPTVTEGDPGDPAVYAVFQVTLSRYSDTAVKLNYFTLPWTAGFKDFVMTSGVETLTIPVGQTTGQIKIKILADTKREATEQFLLINFVLCNQNHNLEVMNPIAVATVRDDTGG